MKIEWVPRCCPICGSTDESHVFSEADFDLDRLDDFAFASRKMPEYMHYRLIVCPICNLLYANPVPTLATIAKAYHEANFDSSIEAGCASRTYGTFLTEIIKRLPDQVGAIDIGTGDGVFLEQLLTYGFTDVVGVEPSKAPVAAAKEKIRPLIREGLFRAEDYESGSFSLVTCFQTLEHLYEPMDMCRNAYKILKKGGGVFFICHNRQSFSAKLLGTKSPIFDIEHLQLFSSKSVKYMLEKAGFVDVKIKTVFNRYPLHYWIKLFPLPMNLKHRIISIFKKTRIGDILLSIPAGNMAVIGYKKG
jgi:SAM-dependent methyltransferase